MLMLLFLFTSCNQEKARKLPMHIKVVNYCKVTLPDSVTICVRFYDSKGKDLFNFDCCQKIKVSDSTNIETETKFSDGDQWRLVSVEGLNCDGYICRDLDTIPCGQSLIDQTLVSIDSPLHVIVGCECR